MKRFLILLSLICLSSSSFALDYFSDTYTETNSHSVHFRGVITYGAHTNTIHLRNAMVRYNFNLSNLQIFATLRGNKDTHVPATDYDFPLNNIELFDFGMRYLINGHYLLQFSGASSYRKNVSTLMLMPHYTLESNQAEFDSPAAYYPLFLNATGIRIGYYSENFEIGYSQSDWRHSIPMGLLVRYGFSSEKMNTEIRLCLQMENEIPEYFLPEYYDPSGQLSISGDYSVNFGTLSYIAEITHLAADESWYVRLEEGYTMKNLPLSFALRQMAKFGDQPTESVFEAAVLYDIYDIASAGVQFCSDGRIYLGTMIDF